MNEANAISEAEALALIERATAAGTASAMQLTVHCATEARASWAPSVDPSADYSQWGAWEAWQWLKIGTLPDGSLGAMPTGEWAAWNRETKQMIAFSDRGLMTARQQAVVLCRMMNGQIEPRGQIMDPSSWGPPDTWDTWKINPLALCTREVESLPAAA